MNWIEVISFTYPHQAHMAKNKLESAWLYLFSCLESLYPSLKKRIIVSIAIRNGS